MIVVSDASPLISLAAIGRFELLRQLYGEVWIPEAVKAEILDVDPGRPGVAELREADWVRSQEVGEVFLVRALEGDLDRGEAEAVALAVELKADLILVDERRGCAVAQRLGLKVLGVVGVLIEAKTKALIPAVRPILDDLLIIAGFRISTSLYEAAIRAAGESPE